MSALKLNIYRAISTKVEGSIEKNYHETMRVPGNVPYVVDNLWEWKRPKEYACRRFSAYASPTPKLALKAAGGGTAYAVELKGSYKLCQLRGIEDSRYHFDCKKLKKRLLTLLKEETKKDWISLPLKEKKEIGNLWIPCLTKKDIEELFNNNKILNQIKNKIFDAIEYWNHVVLIKDDPSDIDSKGELFFQANDGYLLHSIK